MERDIDVLKEGIVADGLTLGGSKYA